MVFFVTLRGGGVKPDVTFVTFFFLKASLRLIFFNIHVHLSFVYIY